MGEFNLVSSSISRCSSTGVSMGVDGWYTFAVLVWSSPLFARLWASRASFTLSSDCRYSGDGPVAWDRMLENRGGWDAIDNISFDAVSMATVPESAAVIMLSNLSDAIAVVASNADVAVAVVDVDVGTDIGRTGSWAFVSGRSNWPSHPMPAPLFYSDLSEFVHFSTGWSIKLPLFPFLAHHLHNNL